MLYRRYEIGKKNDITTVILLVLNENKNTIKCI